MLFYTGKNDNKSTLVNCKELLLCVRKDTITLWKNKSSLSYRIPETWSTSETIQEHFNSKEET